MKNYMITNAMMQMCAGIIKQGCKEREECENCSLRSKYDECVACTAKTPENWLGLPEQEIEFPVLKRPDVLQLPAVIGNTVIYKSAGEVHMMLCGDKKTAEEKWRELQE